MTERHTYVAARIAAFRAVFSFDKKGAPFVAGVLRILGTVSAVLVFAGMSSGCSSLGNHSVVTSENDTVPNAVYIEAFPAELGSHPQEIVTFLKAKGFVITKERESDCLRLAFQFDPDPWHLMVTVELLERDHVVVLGQAVNPGFGNLIARGASISHLAASATSNFEKQCSDLLRQVKLREPTKQVGRVVPKRASKGYGTGFFVSPEGTVLTAFHVIDSASRITVSLADGSMVEAKIEKVDPQNDLAVLKTGKPVEDFLEVGSTRGLTLGQSVFTLGFPAMEILGEQVKFTGGQVSALSGLQGSESLIQVTVPIQPGNSGGPLLSEDGKVVGIITSTAAFKYFLRSTGSLPQNINWAVKSDYAQLLFIPPASPSKLNVQNKSDLGKAVCLVSVE